MLSFYLLVTRLCCLIIHIGFLLYLPILSRLTSQVLLRTRRRVGSKFNSIYGIMLLVCCITLRILKWVVAALVVEAPRDTAGHGSQGAGSFSCFSRGVIFLVDV